MSTPEIDWEALREAGKQNLKDIKALSAKAGVAKDGSNWSPTLLKHNLETWEYYFMLATGFDAVANNGGLVHGLHCYFDADERTDLQVPVDDMLACWKATGCDYLIKAHMVGQLELKRLGVSKYSDLTFEQEEALEKTLDDVWEDIDTEETPFEIRLAAYANKHKAGL